MTSLSPDGGNPLKPAVKRTSSAFNIENLLKATPTVAKSVSGRDDVKPEMDAARQAAADVSSDSIEFFRRSAAAVRDHCSPLNVDVTSGFAHRSSLTQLGDNLHPVYAHTAASMPVDVCSWPHPHAAVQ